MFSLRACIMLAFELAGCLCGVARLEPDPEPCPPGDIQCLSFDGGNCVKISARCDGNLDCKDGADEYGCPTPGINIIKKIQLELDF